MRIVTIVTMFPLTLFCLFYYIFLYLGRKVRFVLQTKQNLSGMSMDGGERALTGAESHGSAKVMSIHF